MAQFPANYPPELKKYGYPPPFPPGTRPEDYGYPPLDAPVQPIQTATARLMQHQPAAAAGFANLIGDRGTPITLPTGPAYYVAFSGNMYNAGHNVNGSGTQTIGDVNIANRINN